MQLAQIGRTAVRIFWVALGVMQLMAVFMPKPKDVPRLLQKG